MAEPPKLLDHGPMTVRQFQRRQGLTLHDLLVLAHDHPPLLPEIVDNGARLVVFDAAEAGAAIYRDLSIRAAAAKGTDVSGYLTVDEFCRQYRIGGEALLRLALDDELPPVAAVRGELVFPSRHLRHWQLGRRPSVLKAREAWRRAPALADAHERAAT